MVYFIGLAGGSGAGKSIFARKITKGLNARIIHIDSFYLPGHPKANYDDPKTIDWQLLKKSLKDLLAGKATYVPIYSCKTHKRSKYTERILPAKILVLEGIFALHDKEINKLMNLKLFLDFPEDIRAAYRIMRDVTERRFNPYGAVEYYVKHARAMYPKFIAPTKKYANVIVTWENRETAEKKLYEPLKKL